MPETDFCDYCNDVHVMRDFGYDLRTRSHDDRDLTSGRTQRHCPEGRVKGAETMSETDEQKIDRLMEAARLNPAGNELFKMLLDRATEWRLALESLTPNGSEFVNDLPRCLEQIERQHKRDHDAVIEAVKARKKSEAEAEQMRELLDAATFLQFKNAMVRNEPDPHRKGKPWRATKFLDRRRMNVQYFRTQREALAFAHPAFAALKQAEGVKED